MIKRYHNGFTIVEAVLILVIAGILAFTGWYVWHSKNQADNSYNNSDHGSQNPTYPSCTQVGAPANSETPNTNCKKSGSYAECIKQPNAKMIETYPEQCIDSNGNSWPNPSQVAPTPPVTQ